MTAKYSDEFKQKIVKYLKTDKAKFVNANTGKRTTQIDSYKFNEFLKNLLNLESTEIAAKRASKLKLRYPSLFAGKVFKKPEMSEEAKKIMRRKSVANYKKKFPLQRSWVEKNIQKLVNPSTGSTTYRLQVLNKGDKGFLNETRKSLSEIRELKKEHFKKFPDLKNYDTELVDDFIKSELDKGNKIKHSELIAKIEEAGFPNPKDKIKNLKRDGSISKKDIIQDFRRADPGEAKKLVDEYDQVIAKAIKDKNSKAVVPWRDFISEKLDLSIPEADKYVASAKKSYRPPKILYYEAREEILKPEYDAAKKWYKDQKLPWNQKAFESARKVISTNQDKWVSPKLKPELLDRAIVDVAKELNLDPEASEAELAKQIYGDDSIKNLKNIRADVSKYSEFLVGARKVPGLDLNNFSLSRRQDLLGHIFYPGMFKFGSGMIGDRMLTVRDYLLKPSGKTLKSMMTALQPGLGHNRVEIDEVIGRAATYEKAPGYTELGQVLKSKINQYKGRKLDNQFARIFNQIMDGKTKDFTLDNRKYNSVEDIAKAWNTKSNAFGKDYGIHTAQLRVGKDLDPTKLVKHFDLLTPEAQKDILRVAQTKGLAIESGALPMTAMTDIWEARGKGIEPKSLSFYKSIVPEFSKQVYATGDKEYIKMWEDRVGCKEGCLATKPGLVGRWLQKLPKGGKTGMILAGLGAVGAGAYAMFGGPDARADEPRTTDQDTMKYNSTTGTFDNIDGDPEDQEGILNWIADNPAKAGFSALPAWMGLGYGLSAAGMKKAGAHLMSWKAIIPAMMIPEKMHQWKTGMEAGEMATDPFNALWALGIRGPESLKAAEAYYANMLKQGQRGLDMTTLKSLKNVQGWKNLPGAMRTALMSPAATGTDLAFQKRLKPTLKKLTESIIGSPVAKETAKKGLGALAKRVGIGLGAAALLPATVAAGLISAPLTLGLGALSFGYAQYKDYRDGKAIVDSMRARGKISEEDADKYMSLIKQGSLPFGLGNRLFGDDEMTIRGQTITPAQQREILAGMESQIDLFQDQRQDVRALDRADDFDFFSEGGRVGMKFGGGIDRRGFLKWLATLGATIAGGASGLFKTGAKKGIEQVVKQAPKKFVGVDGMPAWFPRAVQKIKTHGKLIEMADKHYVNGDIYEMILPTQVPKFDMVAGKQKMSGFHTVNKKVLLEDNPVSGEIEISWNVDDFDGNMKRIINFLGACFTTCSIPFLAPVLNNPEAPPAIVAPNVASHFKNPLLSIPPPNFIPTRPPSLKKSKSSALSKALTSCL